MPKKGFPTFFKVSFFLSFSLFLASVQLKVWYSFSPSSFLLFPLPVSTWKKTFYLFFFLSVLLPLAVYRLVQHWLWCYTSCTRENGRKGRREDRPTFSPFRHRRKDKGKKEEMPFSDFLNGQIN